MLFLDIRLSEPKLSGKELTKKTIDRYKPYTSNIGVTPTYSQVDVTSGGAYN